MTRLSNAEYQRAYWREGPRVQRRTGRLAPEPILDLMLRTAKVVYEARDGIVPLAMIDDFNARFGGTRCSTLRRIERWKRGTHWPTLTAADEWCVFCGTHPVNVYGDLWMEV